MTFQLRSLVAIAIAVPSLAVTFGFPRALAWSDGTLVVQRDAARPDVIVLLTDQQRADAFGAAGAADLHTPVMDRIAAQGVLFTRAFAATPQCSPSRAALLTARYPHRTGVMGNTVEGAQVGKNPQPAGMSGPLDRSLPTLGGLFAAAGYETAYFGKWHLGDTPGEYGFERHNSKLTDATLAREVVALVQQRAANEPPRPLFLIVSWLNPHDIYGALAADPPDASALARVRLPANLIDDLGRKPFPQRHYLEEDQGKPFINADPGTWRRYRAFYNRLVETVDREIGTVLDALERTGVQRITILSSDHGDYSGAHGLAFKGPAMYEEVVRVPLVISWPGRIPHARSDALVSLIDVLPTVCDLTGVPAPPGVDGLSLRPVLEQRAPRVRDTVFVEYYGKQSWRVPIRMARTERWKYVRYLSYGEELYDLAADPGELHNLVHAMNTSDTSQPAGVTSPAASERMRLARDLDAWMQRTGDPFRGLTTTDRSGQILAALQAR